LGEHVIEPRAALSTNDYHHLCNRALGGDVVTELPPFLVAAPIRENRLVRCCRNVHCPSGPLICCFRPIVTNRPSSEHIWISAGAISENRSSLQNLSRAATGSDRHLVAKALLGSA
jgi:hypothetical protein